MEMEKTRKPERSLNVAGALFIILLVFATIITGIRMKFGIEMSMLLGAMEAMLSCLLLRKPWEHVESSIIKFLSGTLVVIIILIDVGVMVGCWIVGGTVPALMYYGLELIRPMIVVPMTFILCSVMSIFTGTSFGSIATMGLALTGVAVGIGVPIPLVAGAAVAGAHVGDKMSPMSDSTNLCSAVSNVGLYEHIGSMMHTTVPAAIISIVIYFVLGMKYTGEGSEENVTLMLNTLSQHFNIHLLCLVPAIMMLVISIMKIPAVLGLTGCAIFSMFWAMLTQHVPFGEVMSAAYSGYVSETGVQMVDGILTRGGMTSMLGTVGMMIIACMMGGALQATGALTVVMDTVMEKFMKTPKSLVIVTIVYNYLILAVSGNQMLGAVMSGPTFSETYDKMNVHRKVLSRCMGDTTINGSALIPWSTATVYAMGVLGTGNVAFIPYEFFCYIVPIFTVIAAMTGWATWHSDGTPFNVPKGKRTK